MYCRNPVQLKHPHTVSCQNAQKANNLTIVYFVRMTICPLGKAKLKTNRKNLSDFGG